MRRKRKDPNREPRESIWRRIWPGYNKERNEQSANVVDIQGQGSPSISMWPIEGVLPVGAGGDPVNPVTDSSSEDTNLRSELPIERTARYAVLAEMEKDPSISAAIKLHVAQALSAKQGTGEIISIESTTNDEDPIVKDLRDTFKAEINQRAREWAYRASVLGAWYIRPYGIQGKGIVQIRSDYYTHPRFIREYERGGDLVGYTHAYQNIAKNGRVQLIEPWKFIPFKIQDWNPETGIEPIRFDQDTFDILSDDYYFEEVVETQDYGESMLANAFDPWTDLQNAILSLNMSRRNAARLERLVGVNTGRLSPVKAAEYLNTVSAQLKKANEVHAKQAVSKGFFQTVINHLLPIFGEKGRLDISTVEGSPNIEGLEDVMFHVKRLCGALGVDPSLIGFGDLLSGGLGDGGFFRMSVMSAIKSEAVRQTIKGGLEELFNIHIAMKYGKFFLPGQRPWRIVFNSISSALEREEQENQDSRAAFATSLAMLVQTLDQEFRRTDFRAFANYLWTDVLRVDEEKFKGIFPANLPKETPEGEGGEGGGLMESAGTEEYIQKIIANFYEEGRP